MKVTGYCVRSEVTFLSDAQVDDEMRHYSTLAFVNQIELRTGWQDCGEHCVIFGYNDFQCNFIIVEARMPNRAICGCENIICHGKQCPLSTLLSRLGNATLFP